ncbi:cation diffusion facilitator family transporter [Actinomadura harenae]|uniref:Cation diffusion facilitator family transporter n=1 Tax=Actinomadura harenae TaxID=2483351 RepID=A0A3M2LR49_9ACTN|nr:cation diffusion facilitator family transporter [Actinomadura harenae]RMI39954.1 cation diffusion facilitator family transporter [Actinomadura harenae]
MTRNGDHDPADPADRTAAPGTGTPPGTPDPADTAPTGTGTAADTGPGTGSSGSGGESTLTVVLALVANLGIAIAKIIAAVLTGSASMSAEAAHSVADTFNEVLLIVGLRRSERPADRAHPLGYGKERYIWTLLVAVAIFGMGGLFAFHQGYEALIGHPQEADPLAGYIVLGVSLVLESISWRQAFGQVRADARAERRPIADHIRGTDDPTSVSVLLEDSAALAGLAIAFAGLGLHQLTGSALWDGLGSILIGVLLTAVALILGRINLNLLVGNQADPRVVEDVRDRLRAAPEVEWVVDIVTLTFGADQILVCARLDFRDDLGAADVERACVRMSHELRRAHEKIDEVFLEPVPRDDPDLRRRVIARYGSTLPQESAGDSPSSSQT